MSQPVEFYPCDREDCAARLEYMAHGGHYLWGRNPLYSITEEHNLATLLTCLFCEHHKQQDLFSKKEA